MKVLEYNIRIRTRAMKTARNNQTKMRACSFIARMFYRGVITGFMINLKNKKKIKFLKNNFISIYVIKIINKDVKLNQSQCKGKKSTNIYITFEYKS